MNYTLQRGGEIKGFNEQQLKDAMQQGWTDQGDLVKGLGQNIQVAMQDNAPPVYSNLLGPDGKIASQYQLGKAPDIASTFDSRALNALTDIGTAAPGTSAWEKMMMGRQGLEEATARDNAVRGADSAKVSAISDIASRGGLSTGAMERLARTGMQNLNSAQQGVARQGALDRFNIGTGAEDRRMDVLKTLPGFNLSKSGQDSALALANRDYGDSVNRFNITNSLSENNRQDLGKFANYQEKMKLWASNNTADAMANSGKG